MSSPDDSSSQSQFIPLVLVAVGVLLIVGALAWFFLAAQPAQPQPPPVAIQPTAPVRAAASQPVATLRIPYPKVNRISPEDAKAAFDLGTAVFIDVRSQQSYDASHIPGAISMTEEELPGRLKELKTSDWIITYCT
jgi:hypothetical protein